MIRELGPLRSYSCRPSERNIKSHTNHIRSTTNPGANASNILLNQRNMESYGLNQMMHEHSHDSTQAASQNSFLSHPSGNPDYPQLWEPHSEYVTMGDSMLCAGLRGYSVADALRSYYRRLFKSQSPVLLDSNKIKLADRLWIDSDVISSTLYRQRKSLTTRANNFVLFESGSPVRYINKFKKKKKK